MTFKLRFSIGLLFSLGLHVFLISTFISWYPGKIKNGDWKWGDWSAFLNNGIDKSFESSSSEKVLSNKILLGKIFFPDILLLNRYKKSKVVKNNLNSQISIESILEDIEKFPKSIRTNGDLKNEISVQVGELLTLISPFPSQRSFSGKGSLNLNVGELRKYRYELNEFLSEKWEVPINLIESNYSALVKFKIKKNGRLLSWEIEESANSVLKKTLENLLKNLQFFPSLPESYSRDSYEFEVKFTPSNLK